MTSFVHITSFFANNSILILWYYMLVSLPTSSVGFLANKQGLTLPICAVIKLEWPVIKSKLGSVKN